MAKTLRLGSKAKPLTDFDFTYRDVAELNGDLPEVVKELIEAADYTHDYPRLARKTFHYVFVYGTLKKGFRNHSALSSSRLVGCGFTAVDRFFLAKHSTYAYPIAFFDNNLATRGRIYGEIYRVHPSVIQRLDDLESNELMYKRHLLNFTVASPGQETQNVHAWTYVGIKDFWSARTEKLEALQRLTPNDGGLPYFTFTKADD